MTAAAHAQADIVICGASHAGLVAARAIGASLGGGVRILLIDRTSPAAPSKPDPRAYALSAGSRRLLEAVGIWPALAAGAEPMRRIEITDSALDAPIRRPVLATDNTLRDGEPAAHIVEGGALREAVAGAALATDGVEVLAPAELAGLEPGTAGIDVCLAGGRRLAASLVIGADGRGSRAREAAGIKTLTWQSGQVAIVATVRHERPHQGTAVQHFLPAGPFAMLPLKGDRTSLVWTERQSDARRMMALDDAAFLAEIEHRFGHDLGRLALEGPREAFPLSTQLARSLTAARLALVGDAAHGVLPLAGQGFNLALRDIAALVECIADAMRLGLDPGGAAVLERYQRWRRADTIASAAAFESLNRLFSNDSAILRSVRDLGAGIIDRVPALKQLMIAEAAGLTGDVPRLLRGELA